MTSSNSPLSSRREAVIPAHNEEATVAQVVRETLRYVGRVIVVDDGSSDATAKLARQAGAVVIAHPTPRGYLRALETGLAATAGDVVITLDADGERNPGDIPRLAEPIEAGEADLAYGAYEKFLRWSEGALSWLAGRKLKVRNSVSGYRALRGDLARRLPLRGVCACGLLGLDAQRLGARVAERPIQLRHIPGPRRPMWQHWRQALWMLRALAGF